MDFTILNPKIQVFINANIGTDITKLALQKNPFPESNWIQVLSQISAKAKAKTKLPTWFGTPNIIYPSKISVEQTSSEKTAQYKSEIVSGSSLIDLTGGFGIDDYFFSKKIDRVVHCEIDPELSAIAEHNFKLLRATNIECVSGDSAAVLEQSTINFDWIFIDPSRRNEAKGKVFMLKDCLPNVPALLDLYFSHAENILIKTAPILDISAGLSELKHVKKIHIVATDNEVKELNWELARGYSGDPEIKTINLLSAGNEYFEFVLGQSGPASLAKPGKYIYEPNSAIMKSGGFDEIGLHFELKKLHPHSHLYTSDTLIEFPGRRFEINSIISYEKNSMKALKGTKLNVTVRNFPQSVEEIRKKWTIKDGGNVYSFFTTDLNNDKIVLLCTKI